MSEERPKASFPRGPLIGAALLIGLTITVVAAWRLENVEPVSTVDSAADPRASIALRFEDRPNGRVHIYQAGPNAPDEPIAVLQRGQDNFIRGVLRALTRDREARGIGREQPFRLVQSDDGRLLLEDPATNERIFLQAFGPDNVKAFERLLADKGSTQ